MPGQNLASRSPVIVSLIGLFYTNSSKNKESLPQELLVCICALTECVKDLLS